MQRVTGKDGKKRCPRDLREPVVVAAKGCQYVAGHSFEGSVLFVVATKTLQELRTIESPGQNHVARPGWTARTAPGAWHP